MSDPDENAGSRRSSDADESPGRQPSSDADESAGRRPPRGRRFFRFLIALVVLAVMGLAGTWAWLESAAGRDRTRRWLEARGAALLQRPVRIADLDWNLLPFSAEVSGIEVAGAPGADEPLLRVASVEVRIRPWALLSRELRLTSVEVHAPSVHWDADSGSNLALEAGDGGALTVTVERLAVIDGTVEINHRRWNLDTALDGVNLQLAPVASAASSRRRSGLLRVGAGDLMLQPPVDGTAPAGGSIELVAAEVPFTVDEDRLTIEPSRLVLGGSELSARGTIDDWRNVALSIGGAIDVADLIGFTGLAAADEYSGIATLDATLTYGPGPLQVTGTLSSASMLLAAIETTALSAAVDATAERIRIDDLSLSSFGGTLTADLLVDLTTDPRRWELAYQVSDIDMNALSNSPALPGFRIAGTAGATGSLTWQEPLAETISGSGSFDLTLPSGTLERLAQRAPEGVGVPVSGRTAVATRAGGNEPAQRVAPSLPLPVSAHAEYELEAGAVTINSATASLPNTTATLTGTLGRDRTVAAEVAVESQDLRILDRFFNQIRRFRGEEPAPQPLGLDGGGRVEAEIGGTLDDPVLDGTLQARALSVAGNPIGDIDGGLRLAGSSLHLVDLRLRRDGGTGEGEGRLRLGARVGTGPDYSFGLRLQDFPVQVELPRLGMPMSAAGRTSGQIELSGAYGGPPIGLVTLGSESLRINALEDLSADIRVRLDADAWVAEQLEITGPSGRVIASGRWRRDDDTVEAQLDAFDVDASFVGDLTAFEAPLGGSLQLQAFLTGPFSAPDAAATLRWTDASVYDINLGAVASSAELRGRAIAVSAVGRSESGAQAVPPPTPTAAGGDVAVPLDSVPAGGWAASLSTDLGAPRRATVRAAGGSDLLLALLAAQGYEGGADVDVSGTVDVAGTGVLGEWSDWQGDATLSDFELERPGLRFSIPEPLQLELGEGLLRVELPRLVSAAGSLRARGIIDVPTRRWREASATGEVSLAVLGALSDELDAAGTLEVDMEASGEVLAGDVTGSFDLREVSISHADLPWDVLDLTGTVRLADERLELVDVRGLLSDEPFSIDGSLPVAALTGDESSAPLEIALTVDALPLAPLWERSGALTELMSGGEAAVVATVRGRGTDWRTYDGRIDVRALRVELTDLSLSATAPAALRIDGDRLEIVNPIVLQGPGTDLRVGGAFLFAPFRLDMTLEGEANLDPLNDITRDWGLAGRAELDMRISGDPPDLSFDGTMSVREGLLNAPVLQPIENISAVISLDDRRVRIDSFTGALGSTSVTRTNVSGDGEIQLVESVPRSFIVNLDVDEAALRIQEGIRVNASAELLLEGSFERSLLSGTMSISEGEYTRRWDEDMLLGLSGARAASIDHPLARAMSLDIDLAAPGDLRINNNMADVELSADLQVRGTLADPVLLGRTTVLDGSAIFRDQRYTFQRGSIEFQNPLRTEPNFDIAMETSIRQYFVTVIASGSPARGDVEIDFVSSPPLSDLQLIQLLTVGTAPEDDADIESVTLGTVGAQATSFLTRQYLSQVERGAQQVFGIDRFNVEPAVTDGTGDPTARVTIGKQVTPDLWISWTSVLGTTDEQLVSAEYQLTRSIRLTATREEDGSLGVDIRFDHRLR